MPDSKSDMKVDQNNEKRPRSQNSESSTESRREITSPNKKSSSSSQTKDSGIGKGANMANVMTSSQELRRQQQGTLSAGSTTHRRDNSGERNRRSPSHNDTNGTESDSAKSSKRSSRNRPASPANQLIPYSAQFLPTRKMFDKGPGHVSINCLFLY